MVKEIISATSTDAAVARLERRFQLLAEIASDWFWQTDSNHCYIWFSENVIHHTGVPASWHLGKSRLELFATATDAETLATHRAVLERRAPFSDVEVCREGPDGLVWVRSSGIPLFDEAGEFEGYLGTGRNITALKQAESRLAFMAAHDALTGLANRRAFETELEAACQALSSSKCPFAVVLIDLDGFKSINDRYGHDAGDFVLMEVAERLSKVVEIDPDMVARLGGDEFACLLWMPSGRPDIQIVLEDILSALEAPYDHKGRSYRLGASLGAAYAPSDGTLPEALRKHADLALYSAKAAGKGRLVEFDRQMVVVSDEKQKWHCALRSATEFDQFELDFLPVVDLETDQAVSYEALLRWCHPSLGRLAPCRFLDAAKEAMLLGKITEIVVERAIGLAGRLNGPDGLPGKRCPIAVNIGFAAGYHQEQLHHIGATLDRLGVAGSLLAIDLVETDLANIDSSNLVRDLSALVARGVTINLDGFGVGCGAFLNLLKLPIETVKLDRRLSSDIAVNPRKQAIVRGIMEMCRASNVNVIVKHIETEAQREWLTRQGCRFAQGFLFGRPVSESSLLRTLHGDDRNFRHIATARKSD